VGSNSVTVKETFGFLLAAANFAAVASASASLVDDDAPVIASVGIARTRHVQVTDEYVENVTHGRVSMSPGGPPGARCDGSGLVTTRSCRARR
jgi:hypothetical protein